ncbi:MAG: hypothetical protein N2322_06830, partial [Terrimicrobiaceae bacterium]|nr:hypothetical protein [Terrimicrobiaceae bacterium]
AEAVGAWLNARPRRGLAVLVSDGFGTGLGDAGEALGRLRHAGHEAAMVQVLDPSELEPPGPGEYLLEDIEGGASLAVVVDAAVRRQFRERLEQFLHGLDALAASSSIPMLRTLTSEPLESALSRALAWA